MRRNTCKFLAVLLLGSLSAAAQVIAPVELKDPAMRNLQEKYMDDLKAVGQEILTVGFTYPFYLSRKLDIDEQQQKTADQHSIRFDHFNGKAVLAITGNYYAAYSAEKLNGEQRARETFLNVIMPILKAAVPRFQNNGSVQGYALEISHHVLGKVMDVSMERPENLVVFLPQNAALKLLSGKDESARQAALLEGQVLLNASPVTIWLNGQGPQLASNEPPGDTSTKPDASPTAVGAEIVQSGDGMGRPSTSVGPFFPRPLKSNEPTAATAPPRDASPEALSSLQAANKEVLATILKELDPQAHFVPYAPPSFVSFRQGIYLELSMTTALSESASGSRYKLAAFAFDEHIAHLIRPMLAYFKEESRFDGIGLSTTIHLPGKAAATNASEAVEFFFPFSAMRCYGRYDCTGQQLIDAGSVLINGERVSLDLQIAEATARR
jgi:hypothetical protein